MKFRISHIEKRKGFDIIEQGYIIEKKFLFWWFPHIFDSCEKVYSSFGKVRLNKFAFLFRTKENALKCLSEFIINPPTHKYKGKFKIKKLLSKDFDIVWVDLSKKHNIKNETLYSFKNNIIDIQMEIEKELKVNIKTVVSDEFRV